MAYDGRIRDRNERRGVVTGIAMTVALHVCALVLVSFSGLKYIYPPPEEKSLLIDFSDDPAALVEEIYGNAPQAEEIDPDEAVNLVQQSASPETADRENLTPETAPDDFGDVDTPAPEPEQPALDPRAVFPGMAKKDTTLTAMHAASDSSALFKAGQADGNTRSGRTDGKPNAHLEGRRIINDNIPLPEYNVQKEGTVVVTIWVNIYGEVVKAVAGSEGSTTLDAELCAAARNAAIKTRFTRSTDIPLQQGTITYYFNLK